MARPRFLALLCFAGLGMAVLFSGHPFRQGSLEALLLHCAGWALIVSGIMMRTWATLYLGGRKTKELMTEGPFSLCRNPLYLGSFCIALGFAAHLQSLSFFAGTLLLFLGIFYPLIREEEARLVAAFGEPYLAYKKATPRVWPRRFGGWKTSTHVSVHMLALRRHCVRCVLILIASFAVASMSYLQDAGSIPQLLHLP
ncbi:MAG: isoprenylcysteine carboxylmethyltransferase family protein [Planctomycetes bacterium]|nr:isoprenylcysteine carboxylmethyltransferase family protein [Planctomycetota bacterium]